MKMGLGLLEMQEMVLTGDAAGALTMPTWNQMNHSQARNIKDLLRLGAIRYDHLFA